MKRLLALAIMFPIAAQAEQGSVICKTLDTGEYIDVVSKGSNTNDVLMQISGGKYFDGVASFDDPLFKVIVPFDEGVGILVYNIKTDKGGVALSIGSKKQTHEIVCVFR